MFDRTTRGLANEHRFYKVDLVVYCEGKDMTGEGSSLDESFWKQVFKQNGKTVYCKSMGAKSVLIKYAKRIIDEKIPNTAVAMDRDYDDMLGDIVNHPQVFYTYGYSWESDVMLDFKIESALSLFVNAAYEKRIHDDFMAFRDKQSSCLCKCFALDCKYIGCGEGLFNHQKPMSIIEVPINAEPYVKIETLLEQAKTLEPKMTVSSPNVVCKTACGVRLFCGKVVSRLFFHWFVYRTKNIDGVRNSRYDTFMSSLVASLDMVKAGVARNEYYATAIAGN